jgi:hypothetical protein
MYSEGMRVALWEKFFTLLQNFSQNKDDFSLLLVLNCGERKIRESYVKESATCV